MPVQLNLPPTFADRLKESDRALIGLWACSGSAVTAELMASSGCDWVLIDAEHTPNDLQTLLHQLYAVSGYPVAPVVRPVSDDHHLLGQYLDLGVQNLLIPMVESAEQAREIVSATRYPIAGTRGVGAALARGSRWNRVDNYIHDVAKTVSITVQIESAPGVENANEILAVDGIDAIFVGPSDLSASMGLLGQQNHEEVVASVLKVIEAGKKAGKPVGVNAFVRADADMYLAAGASFVNVGADVAILARQTEALVDYFIGNAAAEERASY